MSKFSFFKKWILMFMVIGGFFVCDKKTVFAADEMNNINVSVPANIDVIFNEDGTNSISQFMIENDNPISVTMNSLKAIEYNEWKLVSKGTEIPLNTKEVVLEIDGNVIYAGDNVIDIAVPEYSEKEISISIERGEWSLSESKEAAIKLDVEYSLGKKQFSITFDGNGSDEVVESVMAYNGEIVTLPIPTREGYEFSGWLDGQNELHTDSFTMPVGDVVLKAVWTEVIKEVPKAYAIYCESDGSFTFDRPGYEILAGDVYDGKTVTEVYTGFEEAEYKSNTSIPWTGILTKISSVTVKSTISPISTAYWFYGMKKCTSFDMEKLDVSNTHTMKDMFYRAGYDMDTLVITGLENWNTGNVTDMQDTFRHAGAKASTWSIGDLSNWDVSKVTNFSHFLSYAGENADNWYVGDLGNWNVTGVCTDMSRMFYRVGYNSETVYIGDLSRWNTENVTDMAYMFCRTAYYSSIFEIGDISGWDTGNVVDMQWMFNGTGCYAAWSLDCSGWDVSNVTSYLYFNDQVQNKVTAPDFQ